MRHVISTGAVALLAFVAGCADASPPTPNPEATGLNKLNHIVVIYLENHSFDNLYGEYAGAEGLASSTGSVLQIDPTGLPYRQLPPVMDTSKTPPVVDKMFPTRLLNAPFSIEDYVPVDQGIPDLISRYYQEQLQIDGGRMDKFAQVSDAGGLVMGYYHTMDLPLATFAAGYSVCDQLFHSAFGGSFLNHQWLIAASTPSFPNAPASTVAVVDSTGAVTVDGFVTSDGYVINTAYSVNSPHPADVPKDQLVPNQTNPTIGDRLTAASVTWAWYAGGWNDALAGNADPSFQFHHQPFVYYANYADGTAAKAQYLKDETDFLSAAAGGTLPSVSFVKPLGTEDEHPGYSNIVTAEQHALDLINAVMGGPNWKDSAIIVTYDENGGFWDHVPPPKADRWGPGSRVPTIVISPYARSAFVDHTKYETTSILATIEHRFGVAPLSTRDAHAADLSPSFDFSKSP